MFMMWFDCCCDDIVEVAGMSVRVGTRGCNSGVDEGLALDGDVCLMDISGLSIL